MAAREFWVRFWGVRGSIPTSDPATQRYGGNTSCLEICCDGRTFIFDAGTGIRYLGNEMMRRGCPLDADVFLTHTHFDHVCGIPFFVPFFVPGNSFRIWAGHLLPVLDVHKVLTELMMAPLFPVPPSIFNSSLEFRDFHAGDTLHPADGVTLQTTALNHPNGATGYRVDFDGRSICYLTDTEHYPEGVDENARRLIEGADLVIYDSMYTPEEYESRIGWGHSTWQAGAELCDAAGAGTLVIFHHDPEHCDQFMDRLGTEAMAHRPGTVVAREGLTLHP